MSQNSLSSFGEVLKAFRTRAHLTQQQIATRLGLHRNSIGRWERGDVLPDSRGIILELARHLQLNEKETRQILEASLTGFVPYWTVPFLRHPFFTGREQILESLHTYLSPDQATTQTQPYAIYGLGGMGKTQLAVEYAYQHMLEYSAVFWIGAETVESISSSFLAIADVLQLPERTAADQQQSIAAAQRWLDIHSRWLLIWDNLEDLSLLSRFLPRLRQGSVLITTRHQAVGTFARGLALSPMLLEEGVLLLLRRAKILPPEATAEQMHQLARECAAAQEIVMLLGGLPLALDQAGAYIEETGCSLSDYRRLYEQQGTQLLARRGSLVRDHPSSVMATFKLIWQRVEQEHPAAADLLRVCTFLHAEAIPEELLSLEMLHLPADPIGLDQAIAILRGLSLVQRDAQTKTLAIHRLVQAVLAEQMDEANARQCALRTIQAVNAAFPSPDFVNWSRCERYLHHAWAALLWVERLELNLPEAGSLFQKAGHYLGERSRDAEAEPFLVKARALQETGVDGESLDLAVTLDLLAQAYWEQGNHEQAGYLWRRALAICERLEGAAHPQTLACLNSLARFHWNEGKYRQAAEFWQRGLAICEQLGASAELQMALYLNNLGFLSLNLGEYEQAETSLKQALSIRERRLQADDPLIAYTLGNLGDLYREQGRYRQAQPLLERSLSICEQHLRPEHLQRARRLERVGKLYHELGHYRKAQPLLEQALALCTQNLPESHTTTLTCMASMGTLYQELGNTEEATRLLERALAVQEQHEGPDHPETADYLCHLGTAYQQQGKDEQAEPLLRRALDLYTQFLGQDHPQSAHCLRCLSIIHLHRGEVRRAEWLLQQAEAIYERRLGADHPQSARCLMGRAQLCLQEGQYREAEELCERARLLFEQRLGQDHPDTARSLEFLASLSAMQSNHEQAESRLARALPIFEQCLGPAHPETIRVTSDLRRVRERKDGWVAKKKADRGF